MDIFALTFQILTDFEEIEELKYTMDKTPSEINIFIGFDAVVA